MTEIEARPRPAYMHGAVRTPDHPVLLRALKDLHEAFPLSLQHRKMLREAGSEFVYARAIASNGTHRGQWIVLLRFGAVLEGRFGFTREVPIIYSPFADLQIRTTDGLESYLAELPVDRRSVSNSEIFISAPDPRLATKLDAWSRPSRVLLPLPSGAEIEKSGASCLNDFINLLARSLASRDLYASRGYVTGDQFFGRSSQLQRLRDAVRRRETIGVFGLRKTGKTSLLHELIRGHDLTDDDDNRRLAFVYQDLEHLPSLDHDPIPDLLQDMAEQIRRKFKSMGLRTQEMAELAPDASPSQFRRALDSLLEKIEAEATLVVILDEIEYLCPPNPGPRTADRAYQRVRELFGGLRKLTQERDNFCFIIAGLASASIESAELYGAPNPLFSYAEPLYLSPLDREDSEELLNYVGKKVSLHWTESAVDAAFKLTSGHALLLRELGSCVLNDQKHGRTNIAQIKAGNVAKASEEWRERVTIHLSEVLPHLRRYYPEDAELAVMLIEEAASFSEYRAPFADSVRRLQRLGIIEKKSDGSFEPSSLLTLSYGYQQRELSGVAFHVPATFHESLTELIQRGEDESLEFKATLRSHSHEVPDSTIVDEVLRALLGFLNRSGGTLLVGVTDEGELVGVEQDIAVCGSADKMLLFLTRKIDEAIGVVGVDLITVSWERTAEARILRCDVKPAPSAVFPRRQVKGKSGLWVRNNASTQHLQDEEVVKYIARHWS